ncbi:MAG TPA: DUF5668 domain-containing protein [Vicinamibacteria bacterium]|nr:DUF5668 domain-containing protein [Vicinamibacteria bacterium]
MASDREGGPGFGEGTRISPRLVIGFSVMAVGLLLTLDNLGLVHAGQFWRFWPLVLVALGLARMVQSRQECGRPAGVGLMVLGVFLLLATFGLLSHRLIFPLLLLAVGASIAWRALAPPRVERAAAADALKDKIRSSIDQSVHSSIQDSLRSSTGELHSAIPGDDFPSRLSAFVIMGGVKRGSNAQDFQGGDAFAVMGGCEIDLREASMKEGAVMFDLFVFMGGVEIRVPDDWAVDNRGLALLGGFEDKTRRPLEAKKRLVLTGLAIMGGVEVKN